MDNQQTNVGTQQPVVANPQTPVSVPQNKQETIKVINTVGLHARPATLFIQKANEYNSSIWLESENRKMNAKSLLGVLSLGIAQGMTVTLIADGADENEAVNGLFDLVNTGFAEFE